MTVDMLMVAPLVIGHLALFVLSLNLTHSTAIPKKLLGALNLAMLAATVVVLPFLIGFGPWTSWVAPARAYAILCLATAMVGLPVVTLIRAFRTTPKGVASRVEELDLSGEFIGEGRHNWLLKLPGNQSLRVQKVECEITLPGLPEGLDGLTIVQISDTHFARCYRREFFESVIEEAARWEADLVVFTGDLLDDDATLDWAEPVLGRLRGRLGQYSILGNHDHRLRPGRARRALRKAGFDDLEGRWTSIDLDGSTLALGGTSEPWGPKLDYARIPEADVRIVLSHSPDQFPKARRQGVDLALAGHNHGGQIRLPILGPILMPSRYSRHFDRGFFRSGDSFLYVSQGVGGKHPIRYGCHPEITRLTLRAVARKRSAESRERAVAGMSRER